MTDAPARGLVLVVEDERPIADLVRLYLAREGFGVQVERDGPSGLAAARRLRPVACVLDIALPGLDGTEICRRLRAAGDWVPVILLTARDDEVDRIPVPVDTDPGRIRQVLDNLCENALRVLPAGAPLVLAVRSENTAGVLEIRDGGPGFTDDDLLVVFQRGELNRRYRGVRDVGSGLGLALAARLVTRLDGRITAAHAPEGGAMFTIRLPRH
ncbi:ATP-binding response regulator [Actinoplanes sp. G11-F43]|uniref:ATP-binding response regulator n=1 Tax=Actinoplanes sp. G11-F43 TaxID=3424130 RepID=UPI003D330471